MSDKSWNRKITEETSARLRRKPSAVELKELMALSRNEKKALDKRNEHKQWTLKTPS